MEKIKKGTRLAGPAATAFARTAKHHYESGASIRAIAEKTGRSYGAVHGVLKRAGVRFRSRGGRVGTDPEAR